MNGVMLFRAQINIWKGKKENPSNAAQLSLIGQKGNDAVKR